LLLGYALYLPWLITILIRGKQYVKYLDPQYQIITSPDLALYIDVLVIISAIFGIYIFWKWKTLSTIQQDSLNFFLILTSVFLAIAYSFPSRAVNGHAFVLMALFGSIAIVWCEQRIKYISLVYMFLLTIGSLYLGIYFYKQLPNFIMEKSSIATLFIPHNSNFNREDEAIDRVVALIKMNSSEHEPVATLTYQFMSRGVNPYQQIHVANYLASRANRPVVNMRQPEIHYRNQDNLANAKILITQEPFAQLDSVISNIPISQKNGLIKQIDSNYYLLEKIPLNLYTYFYVYKNIQERGVEEQVEHAKVNLYLADLMIIILISLIVWDTKKSQQKC